MQGRGPCAARLGGSSPLPRTMKKVIIVHGWEGSPEEPIHKWLSLELRTKGYEVIAPEMPEAETPVIEKWLAKLNEVSNPDVETIFVGHSIGCQAVLRYLEKLPENIKIKGIVLIAPWMKLDSQTLEEEGEEVKEVAKPWMETPIDFRKVKVHTENITAIFSDNDPYVPVSQKDLFERELGAKIIIEHEKGHFTESDGVAELPSALEAIKRLF